MTPDELEQRADQLRDLARTARTKAQALATHLDAVTTAAADDTLWKGPYPTAATADIEAHRRTLATTADLLRSDADCWDRRADGLDADAEDARAAAKREAAKAEDGEKLPAGAR